MTGGLIAGREGEGVRETPSLRNGRIIQDLSKRQSLLLAFPPLSHARYQSSNFSFSTPLLNAFPTLELPNSITKGETLSCDFGSSTLLCYISRSSGYRQIQISKRDHLVGQSTREHLARVGGRDGCHDEHHQCRNSLEDTKWC